MEPATSTTCSAAADRQGPVDDPEAVGNDSPTITEVTPVITAVPGYLMVSWFHVLIDEPGNQTAGRVDTFKRA
jgi:hypothetical protein